MLKKRTRPPCIQIEGRFSQTNTKNTLLEKLGQDTGLKQDNENDSNSCYNIMQQSARAYAPKVQEYKFIKGMRQLPSAKFISRDNDLRPQEHLGQDEYPSKAGENNLSTLKDRKENQEITLIFSRKTTADQPGNKTRIAGSSHLKAEYFPPLRKSNGDKDDLIGQFQPSRKASSQKSPHLRQQLSAERCVNMSPKQVDSQADHESFEFEYPIRPEEVLLRRYTPEQSNNDSYRCSLDQQLNLLRYSSEILSPGFSTKTKSARSTFKNPEDLSPLRLKPAFKKMTLQPVAEDSDSENHQSRIADKGMAISSSLNSSNSSQS